MMKQISLLRDRDFPKIVLRKPGLFLVDFWAEWCSPCRTMDAVYEEFVKSDDSSVTLVKVNIDRAPDVSKQYCVRSIPTLLLFKDGTLLTRHSGVLSLPQLKQLILSHA